MELTQSIARTVRYARGKGAERFAAIVPEGEYGRRAEAADAEGVVGEGFAGRGEAVGGILSVPAA